MTHSPGAPQPLPKKGVVPAKPAPPNGSSLDFNLSLEGPEVGLPLVPPTFHLGPGAPLPVWAQLAQPRGCPGPPRKHLEPLGSNGPCHGTPPLVQPSCPHSYPPLFLTLSCPCASRTPWSPGGPFLAKAPSLWGEASPHLTEGICPFISSAKNRLSSGMCETGVCLSHPKSRGLLLSYLSETWVAMEE